MRAFVLALLLTAGAVPLLLPALRRLGVVDIPNARSSHASPVVRGGGVAVLLGVLASGAVLTTAGDSVDWWLVGLVSAVAGVGFADDVRTLGARSRLVAQLLVGLAVAVFLLRETANANWPTAVFVPVVVVGFAAFVNAFNFMDGINGISGMVAAVAAAWYTHLALELELTATVPIALAVCGACIGFLPWNAPYARVFLGDVGSYLIGGALVTLALYTWAEGAAIVEASAPLLVYLADTAWALVVRTRHQQPLGAAHRDHVYQRLVDAGAPHLVVAVTCAAFVSATCMAALLWDDQPLMAGVAIAGWLVTYLLLPRLWTTTHRRGGQSANRLHQPVV